MARREAWPQVAGSGEEMTLPLSAPLIREGDERPLAARWNGRLRALAGVASSRAGFAAGAIALVLVAVLVRLPGAAASDYLQTGLVDASAYYRIAVSYWTGEFHPLEARGSGWPLFLALVLEAWGAGPPLVVGELSSWSGYYLDYAPVANERVVYLASALVGAALVPAVILLAREVASGPIALVAGALAAFDPWLLAEAPTVMSEPFYALLIALAAFAILRARRNGWWLAAAGLFAGLAHTVRPNGLLAFVALAVWAAVLLAPRRRPASGAPRVRARHAAALVVAFAVVTAPYLAWRASELPGPMHYGPNTRFWADELWDYSDPYWQSGGEDKETAGEYFATHSLGEAADRLYRGVVWQVTDTFGAGSGRHMDPHGAVLTPFVVAFAIAAFFHEGRRREMWALPAVLLATWALAWMYPVMHWWDPEEGALVRSVRYFSPVAPFAIVAAAVGVGALARATRHPHLWAAAALAAYLVVYAVDPLWAVPDGVAFAAASPGLASLALAGTTLMVLMVLGGEVHALVRRILSPDPRAPAEA